MRKLFTLALAVLASASMWAETTTLPTSNSGLTNGTTKYEWSNDNSQVAGNVLYWATRASVTADETVGLRPNQLGIAIQVTAAVKLTFNVTSNTTSERTITGQVYTPTDELFYVWKNTEIGSSLENYVLAVNAKDAGSMTAEEAAIHANATLGAMTSQKDANKKVLIGETADSKVATAYGSAISHTCPNVKNESNSFDIDLVAGKYLIYLTSTGGSIGIKTIDIVSSCSNPLEPVVLTLDTAKSEASGLYVGDEVTFNISGAGSGAEISLTGGNSESIVSNKWTATEGEHTFVLSQDVKDGVCGNEIEVKLNVASKTPVSAVTVSGPSGTYLDKETTLTCTAENATDYQWYKGGTKIDGATSAEYSFTPDAVGDLVFYCEAWNKFNNGTPVKSADFTVTVTEGVCGVLAELKVTGEKTGTLSGEFTGTPSVSVDKNGVDYEGQTGYKLKAQDSHVGFTLTDGTLKAKDKVIVYVTKVSDGKKLQIFSDKGNTLIAETEDLVLGANTFVLGDDAEGATGVFVYRVLGGTEGAQYNAYIASVTLKRPCGEESSDATLKSLTVGEDDITLEEGKFDYEYEVPADYTDAELAIAFELNDAKATADKKSPLQTLVPDAGNSIEVAINVTAEDGTKATYTITITKPEEAKSDDASIKELKIENEVITAVNDTFSYEVPAEANLSDASVEFVLNHENATASKKSPFLVKVPASGEAATEEELVVTAEDGVTEKTYIISVSRAAEEQGLWDVQGNKVQSTKVLRDGQMYILRGEKTYTIVGAEMQ